LPIPGGRLAIGAPRCSSAGIASLSDHIGVLFRLIVVTIALVSSADDGDAVGPVAERREAVDIRRRADDREVAGLQLTVVRYPKLGRSRYRLVVDALVDDVSNPSAIHRQRLPDAVVVRRYGLSVGNFENDDGKLAVEIEILRERDVVALARDAELKQVRHRHQVAQRRLDGRSQFFAVAAVPGNGSRDRLCAIANGRSRRCRSHGYPSRQLSQNAVMFLRFLTRPTSITCAPAAV